MTSAVWFVSIGHPGIRAEWDWDTLGAPDPTELLPTRRPTSGDFSRHIPRRAYSVTTGASIELESGLEHDLLKWLDPRQDVTWLVAQPVVLHFPVAERRRSILHTPDLLAQHVDGSVTLWDARPAERIDDLFRVKADLTAEACRGVGWGYEIFHGLPTPTKMNLLWLSGYRRHMPWHERRTTDLRVLLDGRQLRLCDVRDRDDGSGELTSTMWHLIATGAISCDQSRPIRIDTVLTWVPDGDPALRPDGAVAADAARLDAFAWTRLRSGIWEDRA